MSVTIKPMPAAYREIPVRLRPMPSAIFENDPTPDDIALARELFLALDAESQSWYRKASHLFDGLTQRRKRR